MATVREKRLDVVLEILKKKMDDKWLTCGSRAPGGPHYKQSGVLAVIADDVIDALFPDHLLDDVEVPD